MTSVTHRNTPSLSAPQTQNTAPVFEHACLFTHDIKRKQKRWQDGSLKYHTFNRRIMVFDMAGNRVGDTHWTSSVGIQEGDEVTLEKWGILVEVSERTGKTQTDLSELRPAQNNKSSARPPVQTPVRKTGQAHSSGQESSHLKHRSLNSLLGSNRMVHGKPRPPPESPFEHRQKESAGQDWIDGRPSKRQKVQSILPPALTRNIVTPAANPLKQSYPQTHESQIRTLGNTTNAARNRRSNVEDVIDLCDDEDDDFDDVWKDLLSDPPAPQVQKNRNASPSVKAASPTLDRRKMGLAEQPSRRATGPGNNNGRKSTGSKRVEPAAVLKPTLPSNQGQFFKPNKTALATNALTAQNPAGVMAGTTSSIVTNRPRKKRTLLCQHQLIKDIAPESHVPRAAILAAAAASKLGDNDSRSRTVEAKLEARLARIRAKEEREANSRPKIQSDPFESDEELGLSDFMSHADDGDEQSLLHDSATELRQLDEHMLPPVKVKESKVSEKRSTQPDSDIAPPQPPARRPDAVQPEQRSEGPGSLPPAKLASAIANTVVAPQPPPKAAAAISVVPKVPVAAAAAKPTHLPAQRVLKNKKQQHNPVSLNTATTGVSSVISTKPFKAPAAPQAVPAPAETPEDIGPWSREAFDLFVWRPPEWDEENWCVKSKEERAVDGQATAIAQ